MHWLLWCTEQNRLVITDWNQIGEAHSLRPSSPLTQIWTAQILDKPLSLDFVWYAFRSYPHPHPCQAHIWTSQILDQHWPLDLAWHGLRSPSKTDLKCPDIEQTLTIGLGMAWLETSLRHVSSSVRTCMFCNPKVDFTAMHYRLEMLSWEKKCSFKCWKYILIRFVRNNNRIPQ